MDQSPRSPLCRFRQSKPAVPAPKGASEGSAEPESAAEQGRVVLKILDALVRQAAGDNESLLHRWQAVRLIRRNSVSESSPTVA